MEWLSADPWPQCAAVQQRQAFAGIQFLHLEAAEAVSSFWEAQGRDGHDLLHVGSFSRLQGSGSSQKGRGLVLPIWVRQCTLWLCRIFHEHGKASSSCRSPGDTVCASMRVHARACPFCRASQCLPRLSFVADGLTVHLPHLNSEADVAG